MDILILTNEFNKEFFGGSGRACTDLVKSLLDKEVDQTVVVPSTRKIKPEWDTHLCTIEKKLRVLELPRNSKYFGNLGLIQVREILSDFPELCRHWDLIHLHAINFALLAYTLARRGIPILYSVHSFIRQELDDDGTNELRAQFSLQEEALSRCQYIHLLSQSQWKYLHEHYPQYLGKAFVLPLGVNPPPLRWRGTSRNLFLYIGRLRDYKGIEDLLHAFYILKLRGIPFQGRIVGSGDDYYVHKLKMKIRKYQLTHAVNFTGWVDDENKLHQWRQEGTALIVPSWREAFGLTAIEGMAVGMPLIVSDIDALVELTSPDCALVYPVKDSHGLANAMIYAIKNQAEMKAMGERAWIKAKNYYWSRLGNAYYNLYRSIAKPYISNADQDTNSNQNKNSNQSLNNSSSN